MSILIAERDDRPERRGELGPQRGPVSDTEGSAPAASTATPFTRQDLLRVGGIGLSLLAGVVALFVVYLVGITPLEHGRAQRGLEQRFATYIADDQAWVGAPIPEGEPVALLEIPAIGVREVVVEGTAGRFLTAGPGHLRASGLPGQRGNAVIAGKRQTFGGPMRHLDELHVGDRITTTTGQAKSTYQVTDVFEVGSHENDVLNPTADDVLTLVTSTPSFRAERRLVVRAQLRTPAVPTLSARPTTIRPEERALHSDRSGALPLLLWLQALILAAGAAVWLSLRWQRWTMWLVAGPVLALLLLLVFDGLAPVLPSTL